MSSSSLSTGDDITVQDLYVADGKLRFKQYGTQYGADPLDLIPVYGTFNIGGFCAPSPRDEANSELIRITRKLINLGMKFKGDNDCANHTGLFSGSGCRVNAGKGVLVRLTKRKVIKGKTGGSDSNYPGFVLVNSKAIDGSTTLLPGVNYVIHGDYPVNTEDTWVKILRDKNSFSQLTGLEAPVDVEVDKQLMFVDGKYKRQIHRENMVSPETATRVTLMDVPEGLDTMTVSSRNVFKHYWSSKRVVKAIKLCNRLGQPLEVSTIMDISQQSIENVIAVIVRCSSDLVGDAAAHGCLLGIRTGDGAPNFKNLTEVTFSQLQRTMVRLYGSDGLYIHRTMGAIDFEVNGEIGHMESGSGAMAPYEGKVKWD